MTNTWSRSSGGDKVAIHDIDTRKEIRSFSVPQATNALAVSADGKQIAVSHKTWREDLLNNPHIRQQQEEPADRTKITSNRCPFTISKR